MSIPFNKPWYSGKEAEYMRMAFEMGKVSGDGYFTNNCQTFFEGKYGFKKSLLTTSCTDALEMAAILCEIEPGDEVIAPSFTFVSTVNAFVLRGAKIIFADSETSNPNIDIRNIESLITQKTKAIIPVHYAGVSCDMDPILEIAQRNKLFVVEDSAQGIDSYYKGFPLGSLGDFGSFSFHETKNIISGEGGMLAINNHNFIKRAEIIREKGTNRTAYFRGEINKYGWVDIGSSFLPSDITAAILYAQIESLHLIQGRRKLLWEHYSQRLCNLAISGKISLPFIPSYAANNAHMFYVICRNLSERNELINFLKSMGIMATFHYLPLHLSDYYFRKHDGRKLPNSEHFSDCLLRLPLFYELTINQIDFVCDQIEVYFLTQRL